ncbi:hypothetical protein PX699_02255 [Sphingobium sp. H39-3-25]|uniref:hypothetical protein n=1 Tax=Sphingobium arseniciresistens TaxID=3030834 RepID=UPI0023B8AC8B|nr:hypothetical protein [Sphingobium arseniciresistens]
MRAPILLSSLSMMAFLSLAPSNLSAQAPDKESVKVCAQEGDLTVLCSDRRWEDLAQIPGTEWALATSIDGGGLHLLNTKDKTDTPLFPAQTARLRPDVSTYGTCAHPPTLDGPLPLTGLAVRPSKTRGLYTVYAVRANRYTPNTGPDRIGMEVFELDLRGAAASWLGCILPPDVGVGLNSIAPLSNGGFLATNFNGGQGVTREKVLAGQHLGEIWEWQPRKGWTKLPGTEIAGPNGIVASRDGKDIYVSAWGARQLVHFDRRVVPARRTVAQLDYRIDNLHWSADGKIIGAAQFDDVAGGVVEIDPKSLQARFLLRRQNNDAYRHFTGAIRVGGEIFTGSSRSPGLGIIKPGGWKP